MPDSSNNVNSGARASAVDWSRPIEAVHEDGRVVPASAMRRAECGAMWAEWFPPKSVPHSGTFDAAGKPTADWRWRIRNVQPTIPERDPALWDRMEALVRRVAEGDWQPGYAFVTEVEARAIVADLPKTVDPDLIEARELCAKDAEEAQFIGLPEKYRAGEKDGSPAMQVVLAAIKRGRELAQGERA